MMSKDFKNTSGAEVIRLRPSQATKASEKKWGKAVMGLGFCIVPSLLLRAQRRLGLNPTQLAVLMHLADYWWSVERRPYPAKKTLADRLGIGPRQVQRIIADLESAGLVERIERRAVHKGKLSNTYDLSGLVERLNELEPDFRQVEKEFRSRRKEVERPGIRRRRSKAPD